MRRPWHRAAGFTILDTMVAALVMIIGTVGLLSMQMVQLQANLRSRQLAEASALAQQQMEWLQLQPLPDTVFDSPAEIIDARGCGTLSLGCGSPMPGTLYTRSYHVARTGPTSAQVLVQVSWQDPAGASHTVSLHDGR